MCRSVALGVSIIAVAGALAGCTALPAAGPSAFEIANQESSNNELGGFILVDIDERVTSICAAQPQSSLKRVFSDRNPAPDLRIGTGDSVVVTIWEAAAGGLFSAAANSPTASAGARTATLPEQIVGRDGSITIPYAGRVNVTGKSPAEVEKTIVDRLEGLAVKPQAVVTIANNVTNTVMVTGEATTGAVVPLNPKGNRILEVIAKTGGIKTPANESVVRLTRGNKTATIAFNAILAQPTENIFLRPRDVITVIHEPPTFTVFGGTTTNATIPLLGSAMTLEEAIAKAGGLNDGRADPAGIFLLRFEPASLARELVPDRPLPSDGTLVPVVYRLNMRLANSFFLARAFQMKNKDILYIANAPVDQLNKFLRIVTPVISAIRGGTAILDDGPSRSR